jgi:serine protease Do
MKGLGTEMIIDSEGRILTANHVAAGATTIKVLLANGDEYPAKVVGTDPKTDLAVIQINAGEAIVQVTAIKRTISEGSSLSARACQ